VILLILLLALLLTLTLLLFQSLHLSTLSWSNSTLNKYRILIQQNGALAILVVILYTPITRTALISPRPNRWPLPVYFLPQTFLELRVVCMHVASADIIIRLCQSVQNPRMNKTLNLCRVPVFAIRLSNCQLSTNETFIAPFRWRCWKCRGWRRQLTTCGRRWHH
jgi:hypothetical protein